MGVASLHGASSLAEEARERRWERLLFVEFPGSGSLRLDDGGWGFLTALAWQAFASVHLYEEG